MGPSIENLEYLIRKPYGCAEQNMVTFAPNIYVLDYLRATQMSSPGKEKKIKGYMEIGELNPNFDGIKQFLYKNLKCYGYLKL